MPQLRQGAIVRRESIAIERVRWFARSAVMIRFSPNIFATMSLAAISASGMLALFASPHRYSQTNSVPCKRLTGWSTYHVSELGLQPHGELTP